MQYLLRRGSTADNYHCILGLSPPTWDSVLLTRLQVCDSSNTAEQAGGRGVVTLTNYKVIRRPAVGSTEQALHMDFNYYTTISPEKHKRRSQAVQRMHMACVGGES